MEFHKMHGIGNDFVVVDARRASGQDWSKLAVAMCDRHFGIGSDGLLLVEDSAVADYRMRMFNPDGSEAEMCGNGIRCFGKYLYDLGVTKQRELEVETGAGVLHIALGVHNGAVASVTVSMGRPRLSPAEIPVSADREPVIGLPVPLAAGTTLNVTCVSMGNPHAVYFLDEDVARFPIERIGPEVEHHPLFPRRVNFEAVNVVGPNHLQVRVWERGAGLTLACGTGACATTVAARLNGLVDGPVRLDLPGGTLRVEWDGAGEVLMTGPAVFVFQGDWPAIRPQDS